MKTLGGCAALCNELGLRFIELNMNLPEYQVEKIDTAHFSAVAEKYGIYYTIHLDENLNPCDFNNRVADAYTETVLRAIELAKHLNIPLLNMHMASGVYFTLPERKVHLSEEYKDFYLRGLLRFRNKVTDAIGNSDIQICIENPWRNGFQRDGIELLLKSSAFALTFDIGHNAGGGGNDEPFIMAHSDRLHHMHIHDFVDGKDHLTLGMGELDLARYFRLAEL